MSVSPQFRPGNKNKMKEKIKKKREEKNHDDSWYYKTFSFIIASIMFLEMFLDGEFFILVSEATTRAVVVTLLLWYGGWFD